MKLLGLGRGDGIPGYKVLAEDIQQVQGNVQVKYDPRVGEGRGGVISENLETIWRKRAVGEGEGA